MDSEGEMPPTTPHEKSKQVWAARSSVSAQSSSALTDATATSGLSTATDTTAASQSASEKLYSSPNVDPHIASECLRILETFAAGKGWDIFYPNGYSEFKDKAAEIAQELLSKGCPLEIAQRFSVLLLYDLVILLDDSSTMGYAEGGRRKEKMLDMLNAVAEIYGLAREKGIVSVRSLNGRRGYRNVTLEKVADVRHKIHYGGVTMIGTQLQNKILNPFVLSKVRMERPLLTIVIINGGIEGERKGLLEQNIAKCVASLQKDVNKTEHSVAFMFARVGNDDGAKRLIEDLDNCDTLCDYFDCLHGELEYLDEISRKGGVTYWQLIEKLMLGSLFPCVDDALAVSVTSMECCMDFACDEDDDYE